MSAPTRLSLPSIISDHMVLQKAAYVPIWGWASPGDSISVSFNGQTVSTIADGDGKWRLSLDLAHSGPGPFEMTVQGRETIMISDILVGEVWLAGGQSNMERALANTTGGSEEVARSSDLFLRQFKVERNPCHDPAGDCVGSWTIASPEASGAFTAVGYYFGRQLRRQLCVPVGLVSSSVGGTGCEPWTSAEALSKDSDLQASARRLLPAMKSYWEKKTSFVARYTEWLDLTGCTDDSSIDPSLFADPSADTSAWTTISLPGPVSSVPGIFWLRNDVELSHDASLEKTFLTVGDIPGFEAIYWNGRFIDGLTCAKMTGPHVKREYVIPPAYLHEGLNTLAIRIHSPLDGLALSETPEPKQGRLASAWKTKAEREFPPHSTSPPPDPPVLPYSPFQAPGYLFNGMINPIIPYAIRGVIWYQGESNTKRAAQYRTAFPLVITDWRARWGRDDFPFYFCQLAAHHPKLTEPAESIWAEVREAQSLALRLPNTAQAVLIDVGESRDIHPRNKKDPGERLAVIALARTYGRDIVSSGPVHESSTIEGHAIRISFSHTEGGLIACDLPASYDEKTLWHQKAPLWRNSPSSEVEGFAICGADRKWVWADARIDGNTVLVWSDKVSSPIAVRYAWADNPTCNLANGAGLLASPFRTDDFPLSTLAVKY